MMKQDKHSKSTNFRIKTQTNTVDLLTQKSKNHRYDTSLYHKTNFHLKPIKDNPQLFTKVQSISSKVKKVNQRNTSPTKKQSKLQNILLPQSISIRSELTKLSGLQKSIQKLLQQDTVMLITAKKWIIFDMESKMTLKGYKHKKQHDIASITKILTFYTAYMIIQKYFISIDKLDLMIDEQDELIQGTKIKIKTDYLLTLEDLLYAMMLESANNAATAIATNLGSLVKKKKDGGYFSCFDIPREDKDENMGVFLGLMTEYAKQLGLNGSSFVNTHGMCKNKSTARDVALLTSECFKIPLFTKIVSTKNHQVSARYISEVGELKTITFDLVNTNKLLWLNSGCIGGKTGCNKIGGQSLVSCYQGSIIVVVLGCGGRQEKFADSEKLVRWLYQRLGI